MEEVKIVLLLLIFSSFSSGSLIDDFLSGAKFLWPKQQDVSTNQLSKLPAVQFEIPVENDKFLDEGLKLLNTPTDGLELCAHRVISTLKKNCKELSLEEIGKLAIMMMNCQLQSEGRNTFPCTPQMKLQQCVVGLDKNMYEIYVLMNHRALAICSALKNEQFRALTEMTIDRLLKTTQSQTNAINEAFQNQRRINDMAIQQITDFQDNEFKIKEAQLQNIEAINSAKDQLKEINFDLQRQLEIHQLSEQKILNIEKKARDIAEKLEKTNEEILQHYDDALKFLNGFKHVMEMISVITSTIENAFDKMNTIMSEIGIEMTQEFFLCAASNIIYFTCTMIFIIFMNLSNTYKYVLIGLFIFNNLAMHFNADTPLMATNLFVWILLFTFNWIKMLKEKMFALDMNLIKLFKIWRYSEKDSEREKSLSRSRSKTPLLQNTPKKKNMKSSIKSPVKSSPEDDEMAEIFEQEKFLIEHMQQQQEQKQQQQSNIPNANTSITLSRPDTPSNLGRPVTPAMLRVMRTDSTVANRSATPYELGMTGRIQCQALTNKGLQCRNAALFGINKCKVHNYD